MHGFARNASQPEMRALSRAPGSAVNAMIGMCRVIGDCFSRWAASHPSIVGIAKSNTITRGTRAVACLMAVTPFTAVYTVQPMARRYML